MAQQDASGTVGPTPTTTSPSTSPTLMLVLATIGFAVNFWAWALISPLGAAYGQLYDLTDVQVSVLVAVPVVAVAMTRRPFDHGLKM